MLVDLVFMYLIIIIIIHGIYIAHFYPDRPDEDILAHNQKYTKDHPIKRFSSVILHRHSLRNTAGLAGGRQTNPRESPAGFEPGPSAW